MPNEGTLNYLGFLKNNKELVFSVQILWLLAQNFSSHETRKGNKNRNTQSYELDMIWDSGSNKYAALIKVFCRQGGGRSFLIPVWIKGIGWLLKWLEHQGSYDAEGIGRWKLRAGGKRRISGLRVILEVHLFSRNSSRLISPPSPITFHLQSWYSACFGAFSSCYCTILI